MKDCLRENHFDTRDNHHSKTNPSYQVSISCISLVKILYSFYDQH